MSAVYTIHLSNNRILRNILQGLNRVDQVNRENDSHTSRHTQSKVYNQSTYSDVKDMSEREDIAYWKTEIVAVARTYTRISKPEDLQ